MPNLTATIPHQLTRAEARQRIADGLNDLRSRQSAVLGGLHETWHGDVMDFSGGVMGQLISGRVDVRDQEVRVEVALPWLLGLLASTVKPRIESQGRKLLSGPAKK
jgi:putative polyhydroxyalkanoate system protein